MAHLYRISDGRGDSGAYCVALGLNEKNEVVVKGHRPIVGCVMQVGSVTARTYSKSDYWITTEVLEILEERDDYVKFRTKNSVYEWRP
jgi:hypothetical protein